MRYLPHTAHIAHCHTILDNRVAMGYVCRVRQIPRTRTRTRLARMRFRRAAAAWIQNSETFCGDLYLNVQDTGDTLSSTENVGLYPKTAGRHKRHERGGQYEVTVLSSFSLRGRNFSAAESKAQRNG